MLVGEDQENGIPQLIFVQHALELLSGLDNTIAIVAVDNKDDTLGVLEVMPPQGPDLVLSTNIPDGELDVLIFDRLNVEACESDQYACRWNFDERSGRVVEIVPIVGMVVTISPSFNLYRIVVFPAASKPTIKILISFFPQSRSKSLENVRPMIAGWGGLVRGGCCWIAVGSSLSSNATSAGRDEMGTQSGHM